jgi:MarR family
VLLNHPTLTKMIDRMVSDSLVYRVQDAEDRRKVLMFSSDRGKALTQRFNSLALSQESHIAESYDNKATADLKRLLESLRWRTEPSVSAARQDVSVSVVVCKPADKLRRRVRHPPGSGKIGFQD